MVGMASYHFRTPDGKMHAAEVPGLLPEAGTGDDLLSVHVLHQREVIRCQHGVVAGHKQAHERRIPSVWRRLPGRTGKRDRSDWPDVRHLPA